jgi:hypothetical protein
VVHNYFKEPASAALVAIDSRAATRPVLPRANLLGFPRVVEFTLMKIHAVRVAATNMKFYINRRFHSP